MTPQHQLIAHHDEDREQYGDCFRTCVACVLDIPAEEVPHRYPNRTAWDRANADPWSEFRPGDPVLDFLAERGLRIFTMRFNGDWSIDKVLNEVASYNPGLHWILSGQSASGHGHVVVCRDREVIWDPHPRGLGLVGPDHDEAGGFSIWFGYIIAKAA